MDLDLASARCASMHGTVGGRGRRRDGNDKGMRSHVNLNAP